MITFAQPEVSSTHNDIASSCSFVWCHFLIKKMVANQSLFAWSAVATRMLSARSPLRSKRIIACSGSRHQSQSCCCQVTSQTACNPLANCMNLVTNRLLWELVAVGQRMVRTGAMWLVRRWSARFAFDALLGLDLSAAPLQWGTPQCCSACCCINDLSNKQGCLCSRRWKGRPSLHAADLARRSHWI